MTKDSPSARYQDYVIKDGRLIGKFDEMYKNADEVPWHQDATARAIFSDHTVTLIRRLKPKSLLDVGCGLGYVTARLKSEIEGLVDVLGIDVSATAIAKDSAMHPDVRFLSDNLIALKEKYDVVVSKDVLWYVLNELPSYLAALVSHTNKFVYIGQSFPEKSPYLGEDIFPNPTAVRRYIEVQGYNVIYQLIERDLQFANREYLHLIIEINP